MEDFLFDIKSINEYGQTLVEFVPINVSLKTHIVNINVPNEILEDPDSEVIKGYVSQFSPQNKWEFEEKFEVKPVLNVQHIGTTGDQDDIPA